jgi:hypothetical protein
MPSCGTVVTLLIWGYVTDRVGERIVLTVGSALTWPLPTPPPRSIRWPICRSVQTVYDNVREKLLLGRAGPFLGNAVRNLCSDQMSKARAWDEGR